MIGQQTPLSKKAVTMVMGNRMRLTQKMFIFLGMLHCKSLHPRVMRRTLKPNYLICQKFQKGQVYIIFLLKQPGCLIIRSSQMWLAWSIAGWIFFDVSNNVVHVEDIIEMHNFYKTLTEAAMYNERIRCHYIAWALKSVWIILMG